MQNDDMFISNPYLLYTLICNHHMLDEIPKEQLLRECKISESLFDYAYECFVTKTEVESDAKVQDCN